MNATLPDPRINAYRADLADVRLKGRVNAGRFVEGTPARVVVPSAPLRRAPRADAPLDTELIRGEMIRVFETAPDGWSWGQNETDGYVGYLSSGALRPMGPDPTHRVTALRTFLYPGPDMKLPALAALTLGVRLTLGESVETRGTVYALVAGGGAVAARHVAPLDALLEPDFVAVAERFLNVPYLWGGRTSLGLDCSALVQIALMAAGKSAPRDTDMQVAGLGESLAGGIDAELRRGDLIFWPGHVAILTAPDAIVHASGHHLAVVAEPLQEALARIDAVSGRPTAVRRVV